MFRNTQDCKREESKSLKHGEDFLGVFVRTNGKGQSYK